MKTKDVKFKDLKINEEFWDYTPEGDLLVKISETHCEHKEKKYKFKWEPDDIIEVEIK